MRRLVLLTALAASGGAAAAVGTTAATTGAVDAPRVERLAGATVDRVQRRRLRRPRAPLVRTVTEREKTAPPKPADVSESWSGLPLTVMVVDGETGEPLGGGVRLFAAQYRRYELARVARAKRGRAEHARLQFDGIAHRLDHSYAEPGTKPRLVLDIDPPAGYMLASPGPVERRAWISRFARSLEATIPLRPVVEVEFDIRAASGHRLTRQMREITAHVGGERYVARTYPPHRIRVPYLRGEELHALVRTRSSWVEIQVPLIAAPRMTIPVRVPRQRADKPNGGHYRGPVGSVRGCGWPHRWEGRATLDVWVRRFDGSPAGGVWVRLQNRTQSRIHDSEWVHDDGRARFTGLPAGEYDLRIAEPGFVTTTASVTLGPGDAQILTMDEEPGVTGDLHVRSPQGLPLPFARVLISDDHDHAGLDADGTQHLDRHTDTSGHCSIQRMSPARIGVSIDWAGLYTSAYWTPGEPLHVTTRERVYLTVDPPGAGQRSLAAEPAD